MSEHKTTRMSELNHGAGADIDHELVPLVKFLNRLGVETISSCQGDPGVIGEGGHYGSVTFICPGQPNLWNPICAFTFGFLRDFVAHMYDDVRLEVTLTECSCRNEPEPTTPGVDRTECGSAYYGWMYFRNEAIDEITKRLGIYCEMNRK